VESKITDLGTREQNGGLTGMSSGGVGVRKMLVKGYKITFR
jgi:hypothetical protein